MWDFDKLLVSILLLTSPVGTAVARAEIRLEPSAFYTFGTVTNGDGLTASNVGPSYEVALSYKLIALPVSLGCFFVSQDSSTYRVLSNSDVVDNFSISPTGYGGRAALHLGNVDLSAGYGRYRAEARRVAAEVGRTYELTAGSGRDASLGYLTRLTKSIGIHLAVGYRALAFGDIRRKGSSDAPIALQDDWTVTSYLLGGGLLFAF